MFLSVVSWPCLSLSQKVFLTLIHHQLTWCICSSVFLLESCYQNLSTSLYYILCGDGADRLLMVKGMQPPTAAAVKLKSCFWTTIPDENEEAVMMDGPSNQVSRFIFHYHRTPVIPNEVQVSFTAYGGMNDHH